MLLPSGWSQNVWDQLLRGLGAPTFSSETVSAQRATSMVAHVRFATETIFFEVVVHVRFWHSSARVVFFKHMVPPFPVAVFIPRLRPNDFVALIGAHPSGSSGSSGHLQNSVSLVSAPAPGCVFLCKHRRGTRVDEGRKRLNIVGKPSKTRTVV